MTFIETIRIYNRRVYNINYHNLRFNKTIKDNFGVESKVNLRKHIFTEHLDNGLYKCRIIYNQEIISVEYHPYAFRTINSLKIVHSEIDYNYKYANRDELNLLFEQKQKADDIIIVKNELVTDSYYANIALFDGNNWYTPSRPLLEGTKRMKYLENGKLKRKDITVEDLKNFTKISLFNAMIPLGKIEISTKNIIF